MSANSLKQQIAALQRKYAKLTVSPSAASTSSGTATQRRRKRRGGGSASNAVRYIAPVVRNPVPNQVRRKKGVVPQSGTIRIKRKEFVTEVNKNILPSGFPLHPESFPWLKNLAKNFDRIVWHGCTIFYKPAVGTNTSGIFLMGIDWGSNKQQTTTNSFVASLTPVLEVPVWQLSSLKLPTNKLMTRKAYELSSSNKDDNDRLPGYLVWAPIASTTTIGHVWVEYDVTLSGTTIP